MSQMPSKIWFHKDTKHSTGDIVCGYQYDFVQGIEDEGGIENFVEYVPADAFIEKAISWLKEQNEMVGVSFQEDFLERFQNYMKGE